ncbi:MAG: lipopolysaccharide heptosyltransferase II [Candidatus Omnitrophota bacterium]
MKILQILPELHVGGVETGTVDLAKYLMRNGHEAVVVSNGGELVGELEKAGVKHFKLPVHKKSLAAALKSIRSLEKIIRDEKVDIVHARSRVPGWIAYFACRRTKTAFITTCHGYYGKHFLSRVMGWGKLVIVPSEVIGRHMIDDFNVRPENIRHIARSVDLERFSISRVEKKPSDEKIIAIIGRLTPLKGHPYFLKSMAKVIRMVPNVKIWVIGDAPAKKETYKEELQILVKRLGIADRVEFLGNRRDIPQLLSRTDVLVLSTITQEAFGRVILEAQAAGVPVVATKVGGVVEIIDNEKTGLLVLPKDPDEMAQAVVRILRDQKLAESLVEASQKKIQEKFTLEHMASQTIKTYEELLNLMNILVIKISSLGDIVLITASLKALRKKFPSAKIYCLVGEESKEVLQHCPLVDGLIVFDHKGYYKGWRGLIKFSARLRQYRFDKIIDFQNNRKSHLLSFLSFPLESCGYDNGKWGFLLSDKIKDDGGFMPPVNHQFQILKMLDIELKGKTRLELWPSSKDEQHVKNLLESEWLADHQDIVGINIAASKKWATKNWPVSHMARLCDILTAKGMRVIVTGMEKDKEKAQELQALAKTKPAIFVGKTDILQLAALVRRCRVFVTADSAPLHVAAAMNVPFVALFGPTESLRHIPPAEKFSVIKKSLPCSPCYSSTCRIRSHDCMNQITPEEVAAEIFKLLEN